MAVLTIFNHGTGVDDSAVYHNITMLYSESSLQAGADTFINQGVGSMHKVKRAIPGLGTIAALAGGNLFGYGSDENNQMAVDFVVARFRQPGANASITAINICGYSRGGAVCFTQADMLSRNSNPYIRRCPVNIFAIDPVPGCMGVMNSHMYKKLDIQGNVRNLFIVLAECERRKTFRPILHPEVLDMSNPRFNWDNMPGNHCGIVEQKTDNTEGCDSPILVYDLAKRKLGKWGTPFGAANLMTWQERLGRYARIMMEFDEYIKMGQGLGNRILGGGLTKDRAPRQQTETNSLTHKGNWHEGTIKLKTASFGTTSRFFANNQHRKLFEKHFQAAGRLLSQMELGVNYDLWETLSDDQSAAIQPLQALFANAPWGTLAAAHFNAYRRLVANMI